MKPYFRIAALLAVSVLLCACRFSLNGGEAAPPAPAANAMKIAFHFQDDRADYGGTYNPMDPDVLFIAAELKKSLQMQGYRLVDSDRDADAVVSYQLRSFSFDIRTNTFTRKMQIKMYLATTADTAGNSFSRQNIFDTKQKSINWTFWDTKTAQRRHALQNMIQKVDKATGLEAFLAKNA